MSDVNRIDPQGRLAATSPAVNGSRQAVHRDIR